MSPSAKENQITVRPVQWENLLMELWDLTDLRHQPEGSGPNGWWVGCKGLPAIALLFLRQGDLGMASRGDRVQPMNFRVWC